MGGKRQRENETADGKEQLDAEIAFVDEVAEDSIGPTRTRRRGNAGFHKDAEVEEKNGENGDEAQAIDLRDERPG